MRQTQRFGGAALGAVQCPPRRQPLAGQRLTAWRALHGATRGAAEALGLAHEIGSFDVGCTADVCAWHWARGLVAERRDALASELHERVFAWMTLSDERNLAGAYVAGVQRHAGAGTGAKAAPEAMPQSAQEVAR